MKQIRLIFATLLAMLSANTVWGNINQGTITAGIYQDPATKVEYEYALDNNIARVKAGKGQESDVYPAHDGLTGDIVILESFIPGTGRSYTVTEIGQGAFMENEGITTITIPKTVNFIDRAAFAFCYGLTDIYCYADPDQLSWLIFDYYPEGKNNKATKFHVQAEYLDQYKRFFSDANVTFVGDLPSTDDIVGEGTTGNLKWKVEKAGTFKTKENNVEVEKPAYRLTISGNGEMPSYSWSNDPVTNEEVWDMPWLSFETIKEIVLEEGVKNISYAAFQKNKYLEEIKLPSTIEKIGGRIVDDFSLLAKINFPEGLKSIADYAFPWCTNLKEVHLPSTLTTLFPLSFKGNKIEKLTIAEGNPKFDARDNCNAVILTKENRVYTGTPSIVIPPSVTSIGANAFENNLNLGIFVIPDHITSIGYEAFGACYNLKELYIGTTANNTSGGLTTIGEIAFRDCTRLENVFCYANPDNLTWEDYDNEILFMKNKATIFHVPAGYLATWQSKFPNLNATYVGDLEGGSEPVIEPITEPTTVTPADEAEEGKAVTTESGIVISLGEGDTVDKTDGSIKVTTTMTPDDVKDLLKEAKPDEPDFYEVFKGMYSMLSAGRGYLKVKYETLGDYEITVMVGTEKKTFTKDSDGYIKITYDLSGDEWVFIFASHSAAARAKAGLAPGEGALKIYSVEFVPEKVIRKGDANGDYTVNAADIVEVVNFIMGSQSDKYNQKGGDANEDGTVNAADIVTIVNMIMSK